MFNAKEITIRGQKFIVYQTDNKELINTLYDTDYICIYEDNKILLLVPSILGTFDYYKITKMFYKFAYVTNIMTKEIGYNLTWALK